MTSAYAGVYANMQACRIAGMQTCRHAEMQNCRHADMQICRPKVKSVILVPGRPAEFGLVIVKLKDFVDHISANLEHWALGDGS